MISSFKLLSHRSPLYTILFLIICLCIWQAFGFIIVSKRELTGLVSHPADNDVTGSETQATGEIESDESSKDTFHAPRVYCVNQDCTCKAMGCYKCSEKEGMSSILRDFCASESSYQKFECEGSNTVKYASCESEKLRPVRTIEELRFLKFEVVCFMLFVLSYAVVWSRSKVGERVIIKRIQKLTEEPIS